jgi:hypothetical protein
MLQGKIIRDGWRYCVKVGGVTVDVTDDLRALLEEARAEEKLEGAPQVVADADNLKRYAQIESIVLAGGRGMPT